MIIVKNIYKNFGDISALNDVSFEVEKGVLTLLGANGAGKTTLMRVLTGYLFSNEGSVTVNGIDVVDGRIDVLKNVGYVPENNPIYQEFTAYEVIKSTAELWSVSKEDFEQNLKKLVKELDIKDVINQKIATMSKGYKRRVAIAAGLIHNPKIIILDEPTDGLDPNQKQVVRNFIKKYAKENIVIISTHIMEEVEAVADRVIVLDKGKIIFDGTAQKLKGDSKDMISAFNNITSAKKE